MTSGGICIKKKNHELYISLVLICMIFNDQIGPELLLLKDLHSKCWSRNKMYVKGGGCVVCWKIFFWCSWGESEAHSCIQYISNRHHFFWLWLDDHKDFRVIPLCIIFSVENWLMHKGNYYQSINDNTKK